MHDLAEREVYKMGVKVVCKYGGRIMRVDIHYSKDKEEGKG